MNAKQFWFFFCFLFFVYNLVLLVNDSYSINYLIVETSDPLYDNQTNYMICTHLDEFLKKNKFKSSAETTIHDYLNLTFIGIDNLLNTTNLLKLNETYLFNFHICFPTTKDELEKDEPLNQYLRYVWTSLYAYSNGKHPFSYEKIYYKSDALSSIYLRAHKYKVFGRSHLTNPDCRTVEGEFESSRFNCLNECFKGLNFKRGLYRTGDKITGNRVNEAKIADHYMKPATIRNETAYLQSYNFFEKNQIDKNLKLCFRICPKNDCFFEAYDTIRIDPVYYANYLVKEGRSKLDLKADIYTAYYSMNDFHYQILSLITLFFGKSVSQLLFNLLNLLIYKTRNVYRRNCFISSIYSKIVLIIHLLLCAFVVYRSLVNFGEYKFKTYYPNKTSVLNYSSEPFSLVICFPVQLAYGGEELKNSTFLETSNVSEIVAQTDYLFHAEVLSIYASYGFKTITDNFKWSISRKVLFKNSSFDGRICLSR